MISGSCMLTYIIVGGRCWKFYQCLCVWKNSKLFQRKKKCLCGEQNNWNNVHLQLHNELKDMVITRLLHLLSGSKSANSVLVVLKAITSWWWGCVNEHVKETSQPFIIFFPTFLYISVHSVQRMSLFPHWFGYEVVVLNRKGNFFQNEDLILIYAFLLHKSQPFLVGG